MVIQLIAKNRQEKFQFQGRCKLIIDSLSKLLLVEPFNEEFKMISAMFKWEFVAQKNILFVSAECHFQDFALIFDNTKICNKAIGFLLKKGATVGNKELISQRFLSLIFNEISANNESNLKMKEILFKWIEFFDGKEKEEFIQILKENNIYDLFYSNNVGELQKNSRKRKVKDISRFKETCSHTNISCKNKIVEAPNFEILKYVQNGQSRNKLSIFPSSDERKYCYEYFWCNSNSYYVCYACIIRKRRSIAKIIKRNGKDVVQLNRSDHVCKLRKYKEIIEKPNFEITSYENRKTVVKRLIVFLDLSREFCYEYSWCNYKKAFLCRKCIEKKFRIRANICQKDDGTEFVMVKSRQHLCEPRKYIPEKYGEKEIIEAENFKIFNDFRDGKDKSKLIIFTTSNQSMCYEYFLNNREKNYLCCGCWKQSKYISADICKDDNGNDYVKLSNAKHVCEPCEYDPEKYLLSKTEFVESSNFKIFKYKHHGKFISKLIVFDPSNMNLCYEYYYNTKAQFYQCTYCPMKYHVTATLLNGNETLILSKVQHICELREFHPEKYKDDNIVQKDMYKISSTTLRNTKSQILMIFTSQEKKSYYKFVSDKKSYYCTKCYSSKVNITATLQNEGKENECLFVSNEKHVCEPFESLMNGNINMAPNFQLTYKNLKGKCTQHLTVFTNDEKTDFYDYTWNKNSNLFKCSPCQSGYRIHVYAKIFKNDENQECVELSDKPHQCKPINCENENVNILKLPNFKLYKKNLSWEKLQKTCNF